MELCGIKKQLQANRDKLLIQKGKRDEVKNTILKFNKERSSKKKLVRDNDKLQILLRHVSEYAKSQVKSHIETAVSNALNVIYGGQHKFLMEIQERRNQHEVDYFLDDGFTKVKIEKPFIGKGGGKITVVSLALQLAICELTGVQGPIALDEISKMMDAEARINLAFFLKNYAEKFNRQIILITHHKELSEAADLSINVVKKNGIANLEITK